MESSIKAVVFDLGGVLIDWNPLYLYRQLIPDEVEAQRFLADICTPEWNRQMDAGRPFAEAVSELSGLYPHHEALISAFHTRWPDMLGGVIEGTVAILDQLHREGVALHAISNWSAETFPIARERYPFLAHFGVLIVSGERKLAKPDPAIFELFLAESGLEANACVFIDDNADNIATAAALGFRAVHFHDPSSLAARLREFGLLRHDLP
ncbi:hydrolase [Labrys miyagiensis]